MNTWKAQWLTRKGTLGTEWPRALLFGRKRDRAERLGNYTDGV
jgi:hypothetical protein